MAPAEEGADLPGNTGSTDDGGDVDYGHDFDPSLFSEESDTDATRKLIEDAKEEEKAAAKPTEKAPAKSGKVEDTAKEEGEDDVEAEDEDKGADSKEGKDQDKGAKKPSRAERRIQQLLDEKAALQRQLEKKTGDKQVAEQLTELETTAAKLEKEYHAALNSDPEKAETLLSQLRGVDRKIARLESSAEAEAIVEERFENREFASTITEITTEHPELDKNDDSYNADLVAEINDLYAGLLQTSPSKSVAMRKAVKYVLGEAKEAPASPAEPKLGDETRATRQAEGKRRTAAAVTSQAPDLSKAGTTDTAAVKTVRTLKDLDNISEEELAVARGDFV